MRIQKRYKHLNRLREIANTLAKHGFGYFLDGLGLTELVWPHQRLRKRPRSERLNRGQRLRLVLESLGPTAVKLGQVLSTRPDLLPRDIILELEKLQDQVPPFSFEQVFKQVERELDQPLGKIFYEFEEIPLAGASIGQVHKARLVSGEKVVVKVQRPGIEEIIRTDLEILRELARLAEKHTHWGKLYSFREMADEFARTLREEMDYLAEARNADQFHLNFKGNSSVYVPEIYWNYTTARILTMEFIPGVKLNDFPQFKQQEFNRTLVAENLSKAVFQMLLVDGFFHGDLHPGNIAVLPGNVIALMDFGMVGRISEESKRQFINLLLGLIRRNSGMIVRAIMEMGIVGSGADPKELKREVDRLRDYYYQIPLNQVSLGKAISEILGIAYQFRISLPSEYTLLAKTMITLEGVVQDLDPELSIMKIAEPFGKRLIRERLSPKILGRNFREYAEEQGQLLLDLPRQMAQILHKIQEDRLTIKLEHQNLKQTMDRLDRITNKLTFAIVLLAFSIIMAGLIIGSALGADPTSFFWRLPILHIGFAIATTMIFWLVFSILRTGRF